MGPAFVATFSTTLLFMGVAADNFNRPLVFAIGTLVFSVSCLLMGFADQYWHLVATRVGINSIAVSVFVVFWFILTNTESEMSRLV